MSKTVIDEIKPAAFNNKNFYKNFRKYVFYIIDHMEALQAGELSQELEKKLNLSRLKEENLDLYKKYQILLAKLKLTAIPFWPPDKVAEVLRDCIDKGLADELIDLENRLRIKLIEYPIAFRDEMKRDFREALKKSEVVIGKELIKVADEEKLKRPTIGRWLRDYDYFLGAGKHTKIEQEKYFFQSPNMKKVSKDERKKLLALFKLYDLLKFSSYELGAIDNPSLEIFTPTLGKVERSKPKPTGKLPGRDLISSVPFVLTTLPSAKGAEEVRPVEKKIEEIKPPVVKPMETKEEEEKRPIPSPLKKGARPIKLPAKEVRPIDLRKEKEVVHKEERIVPRRAPMDFTLENLKTLTLEKFRKISSDPKKAAEILKEKIKKLISLSPADRAVARSDFKSCQLYKLYIQMGRESLEQEKTISQISELRRVNNKPYLTEEEFEVVADISKAI